jgi:hypothetical protein
MDIQSQGINIMNLVIKLIIIALICYGLKYVGLGIIPNTIAKILHICVGFVASIVHTLIGIIC